MTRTDFAPAVLEPELPLDAFVAGRAWAPVGVVLDEALVDAYLDATGEHHPLYDAHGFAPPLIATMVRWVKGSLGGRWPSGTLQLDHRLSTHRALRRGETLSIDARILGDAVRGGRACWVMGSTLRDAAGEVVGEQASTSMAAGAAPRAAGGRAPGDAAAVNREPDDGADARDAPDATAVPTLGPLHARFDARALAAFGRVAGALDPIHVDPDYARGTRWGVNIAQGRLVMTLASRLMLERFGERWLHGHALSVSFARAVPVDEPLCATAHAIGDDGLDYTLRILDGAGRTVIRGRARLDGPAG